MKKLFLVVFSFLFLHLTVDAQEQFYTVFRNQSNGVNVVEKDSSYLLIAREGVLQTINWYYFHNISLSGDTLNSWIFQIDTASTTDIAYDNSVNGHFIAGAIQGEGNGYNYGLVSKLNSDYSEISSSQLFDIGETGSVFRLMNSKDDSTIVMGGHFRDNSMTQHSALVEMDSLGIVNWSRNFYCGTDCILLPYQIENALDGGYFFTCQEFWYSAGSGANAYEKTVIIKTDDLGFEEYRYHLGDEDYHIRAGWVIQSNDSNYIAAYSDPAFAEFDQPSNPDNTIWVVKFDIDGNELWEVSLFDDLPISEWGNGYNYTIRKMIKVDNGFLIGGSDGGLYGFLFKLDFEGNLIWKRYYTHPQWEENSASSQRTEINGFTQTSDSGFILTGYYFSTSGNIYPTGIAAAIVIKVDEYGCLEPGCQLADAIEEEVLSDFDFQIFPNPVRNKVRVSFRKASEESFSIKIFNLSGKELVHKTALHDQSNIDVSQLTSGMYILQVEFENGHRSARKFVKE
jgi:hypothetical protein